MPATLRATMPALPALLLGFWLMQTGNTFQGTILSIRGEIEGFSVAQIGAVGAGFALTQGAAPAPPGEGSRISLSRLYHQSPFGVAAGFLGGVTTGAFFTLGPIFAEQRGLDTGEIALFMASGTLGGFLTAWPLGLLSDRHDRRLVIIGAASAAAASLLAMLALVPASAYPWILYLCVALFGGMIVPTYSLALAHLSDAVEQGEMVAASGGLLLVHGAGAVVGPLIAGFAMSASQRGLSYTLVAAQVLIAVLGVYRPIRRAAPPDTHKRAFLVEPPVPVGTEFATAHSTPV